MKKSSLKNYITLLEAAESAAANERDYWMHQHELREEELLEANNERLRRHFADCTEHDYSFERRNK